MLWFKNAVWYRFSPETDFSAEQLEQALEATPFVPCNRHEQKRSGWTSPTFGLTESPLFVSNGFFLICLLQEEKILPSSVIKDALNEKVAQIEQNEGRKVYRKERTQLKDEVTLDLLPRAFTRRRPCHALLAPQQGWIIVDASAPARAEQLLSALRESLGSLKVRLPEVQAAPAAEMTGWLLETLPVAPGFALEEECELRDAFGEGGMIKVKGQALVADEIKAHLEGGMQVTRLALTWEEQLRLVLHDDLTLHRLRLTDQYRDQLEENTPEDELAALDADLAQLGLEFTRLLPQLLAAFGGEIER